MSEPTLYDFVFCGLKRAIDANGLNSVSEATDIDADILRLIVQRKLKIGEEEAKKLLPYLEKESKKWK